MNYTVVFASAASFIAGAIVGGFLVSRKLCGEFAEWREVLEKENKELFEERRATKKKLEEVIDRYSRNADDNLKQNQKERIHHASLEFEDPDFDEHFAEREFPEEDESSEFEYMPPFQISEEELSDDYSDSELTELRYYQGDQMLLDDRGELVMDIVNLLGKPVAESLPTIDEKLIYVHNPGQDTNYEVHIFEESSNYLDSLVRGLDY